MAQKRGPEIVDDPAVREIYANKLVSTTFDGGSLSITMGVARVVPASGEAEPNEASPRIHVTTRLVLSPAAAVDLTKNLTKMLHTLKEMAEKRQAENKPN